MMLRERIALILLAAALVLPWVAAERARGAGDDLPGAEGDQRATRPYFYDYAHEVPKDYVFRTGRVFETEGGKDGEEQDTASVAAPHVDFVAVVSELAGMLLENASSDIREESVVAVTSFVNLNNLYLTSGLGRLLSELLIGELSRRGIEVVDIRKTPSILVSRFLGEYGLSRDMDELSFVQDAQATAVGTYAVSGPQVVLNLRLLDNRDNRVLASAVATLPRTANVAALLADERMPQPEAQTIEMKQAP